MDLTYKRLESGVFRIQGDGPCNFWQGWVNCNAGDFDKGFFPEASSDFRRLVRNEVNRLREEETP